MGPVRRGLRVWWTVLIGHHGQGPLSASFSADGKVGGHRVRRQDGACVGFARRAAELRRPLTGIRTAVISASFSADGTHVVTASQGRRRRGCGICARAAPASLPSRGIKMRLISAVVQHRRNACGHRVFRQDGTGVGFARGAADFHHLGGASGSSPLPCRSARTARTWSRRLMTKRRGCGRCFRM